MAPEHNPEQAVQASGLNFDTLSSLAQHAHTVLEGQELLKRLTSKELAPSFNDAWIWGAAAAQRKQEERTRLTKALQLMAADAVKAGNLELLPAFFRPLKEGEPAQIMQAYSASPRGHVAQAIQSELGARQPTDPTTYGPALPSLYAQAQGTPGNIELPVSAPPTMQEQAARAPDILQRFLPLLALAQGKSGDIFKALEENRKQQESLAFDRRLNPPTPGVQGPAIAPVQVSPGILTTQSRAPQTPEERAEFQDLLVQTQGDRPSALAFFNERRAVAQAEQAQAQAPGQPYTPTPFPAQAPYAVTTMTKAAGGGVSQTATMPSAEERIPGYVRQEMARGGYRALGPALAEAYRVSQAQPKADQLKELKAEASQLAYQEARARLSDRLKDPDLHIAALQEAAAKTRGFFSGQDLGPLQNPLSLRAAETLAGLQAGAEHRLSLLGREVAQADITDAVRKSADILQNDLQIKTAFSNTLAARAQIEREMADAAKKASVVALSELRAKADFALSPEGRAHTQQDIDDAVMKATRITVSELTSKGIYATSPSGRNAIAQQLQDDVKKAVSITLAQEQARTEHALGTQATELRTLRNAEDVTKAVQQHTDIAEAVLDAPITDPVMLAHYPGTKPGITRRELVALQPTPTTAQSVKDTQALRTALAAIDSMEKAFIATAPPENAVTPQRLARATVGYFLGTEKAMERYTTRRNFFMQSIAQVVGDQDKRFNETELKLLDEALPRFLTRKSTAKDAFNEMRRQVQVKFSTVASTTAPPAPPGALAPALDDAAQQARKRAQRRFAPGVTP